MAVLGVVILVVIVGWISHHGQGASKSAAGQVVPVHTAIARQGTFIVYQSAPGTVNPSSRVVVRSRVDGELTRVTFTGGQIVKKGQLLAEIDPRPFQAQLELAKGDLARSQAQLANATDTLTRYKALLGQDSIARQRVEDQQSLVRQYAAEVKANQGRVDSANLQLSNTRITTPITGTVSLRQVDPGNLISASDTRGIAVVTQSQPSNVVFSLPVAVVPHVMDRLRSGTCIPVDAYGDGSDDMLDQGQLLAVNNQVDPATGTVKFEAEFANSQDTLLPDQFVTAKLPVDIVPSATLVPTVAIQHGAQGAFLYVVGADETATVVPVKVGPGNATITVIVDGIAPGAKVVTEGADRLRAGTPVHAAMDAPTSQPSVGNPAECRRDNKIVSSLRPAQVGMPTAAAQHPYDSTAHS